MRFTTRTQGTVGVVQVDGAMLGTELASLSESVQRQAESGHRGLLFDLTSVPALDSAALELMLDTQDACRRRGSVLKLTGLQPLVAEVFAITGLDRHFEVFPDQVTALGSFST